MLTDLSCKALITSSKRQQKPHKKADANGLFLHAFPSGSALWKHKYRIGGLQKEISYGPYHRVSLREARDMHAVSYKEIKAGRDPSKRRQEQSQQAQKDARNTFGEVAKAWYNLNVENWTPRHAKRLKNRLEKNLHAPLGKHPIKDISRKTLLRELRLIEDRSRETAKRCTQYAVGIFRYALDEEYIDINIALDLQNSLKPYKQGHYPSMHIDELPAFLKKLAGPIKGNTEDKRDVVTLLMLTLVRSMELLSAEWTEFDFEKSVWVIPAGRMKMKRPHVVPLSSQAKAILLRRRERSFGNGNSYPSPYVFPSERKPAKHICHTTGSATLIELGCRDVHSCHGFRALGMGIAKQKLGYRHEVPNKQLAHEPKTDVDRAYDRADFMDERIEMMQRLANFIDERKSDDKL